MHRLTKLSEKESSSEQGLEGVYHVVVDLRLSADKKVTLEDVQKKVAELGGVEDLYVEKYSSSSLESPFNIGDTIELSAEFSCAKTVYLDTLGNLVISDKPAAESVERVGDFRITLPKGTLAEVNNNKIAERTEVLFTGESVHLAELGRDAYLGILELPSDRLIRSV